MVWYLLYMMLFGGGSSPIIVPKLDNYVKEYVVDEVRRDSIIELIKISDEKTEETAEANKDLVKTLKSLYKSRVATHEEFENTVNEILNNQKATQKVNLMVIVNSHKQITSDEWDKIQNEIYSSLEKSDKDRKEKTAKQNKKFDKLTKKISKNIADKNKRKLALDAVAEAKKVYSENRKTIQNEFLNRNSVIYKYKASEKEISDYQNKIVRLNKEFFEETFKAHFKLVELTTEEEWNDIY